MIGSALLADMKQLEYIRVFMYTFPKANSAPSEINSSGRGGYANPRYPQQDQTLPRGGYANPRYPQQDQILPRGGYANPKISSVRSNPPWEGRLCQSNTPLHIFLAYPGFRLVYSHHNEYHLAAQGGMYLCFT
ncbi:hypothetical protein Pmar_PMAR004649 [Perkinsus marinus ATCC 50983]|uniref:Uncharacterized protein n=1 Tax=Perkinsus marinus (strain ATCC 50983 / TXsc) TaxID=423536 RepID=C5KNU2_PERM5|nr:hypothetical protein Pmar_PMAR004649 [Perkinsus marinus ATCC 50983]EER13851.1 hypothetical protein Pmar_PMAR004649 [Perkinsus marinus ATCC 50983]|eukprot:XP_002782056.1 hypothetical protein Pmar_PMAR004649 [Perkinsus marinus ATCC 50983]